MMDHKFDSMELEQEDNSTEFTIAEVMELENSFKKMREGPISEEVCQELAAKFNCSARRLEASLIKWEQIRHYFEDRQRRLVAKVTPPVTGREIVASAKAVVLKKRSKKEPTVSAYEASLELSNLNFEARSAKDYAWFDVGCFLNYRVLYSGELEVRVRFAGFGNEEDEWVNVKHAVRDRSIPLDSSECGRVNVGDLVLCYREGEDNALYTDAYIVEIERNSHDGNCCTCIFAVRYEVDDFEEKVPLSKICCRPTHAESRGNAICMYKLPDLEYNGVSIQESLGNRNQNV